jgi:hypothetical protein
MLMENHPFVGFVGVPLLYFIFSDRPAGAQALLTHGWVVGKCRSQGSDSKTQSTRHLATFSAKPLDPPVTHDLGSRLLCLSFSAISASLQAT